MQKEIEINQDLLQQNRPRDIEVERQIDVDVNQEENRE